MSSTVDLTFCDGIYKAEMPGILIGNVMYDPDILSIWLHDIRFLSGDFVQPIWWTKFLFNSAQDYFFTTARMMGSGLLNSNFATTRSLGQFITNMADTSLLKASAFGVIHPRGEMKNIQFKLDCTSNEFLVFFTDKTAPPRKLTPMEQMLTALQGDYGLTEERDFSNYMIRRDTLDDLWITAADKLVELAKTQLGYDTELANQWAAEKIKNYYEGKEELPPAIEKEKQSRIASVTGFFKRTKKYGPIIDVMTVANNKAAVLIKHYAKQKTQERRRELIAARHEWFQARTPTSFFVAGNLTFEASTPLVSDKPSPNKDFIFL